MATPTIRGRVPRIAWLRGLVSVVMAAVIGFLAGWGSYYLGAPFAVSAVVMLVAGVHLYRKPTALKAFGVSLYWVALVGLLIPVLIHVPAMVAPAAFGEPFTPATTAVGYLFSQLIFGVSALVIFIVGYFVNNRANRRLNTDD